MTEPADPTQFETYSPCESYCPPKGRLAILGRARADIDKVRSSVEAEFAAIAIQIAAQKDSHYKIYADVEAMKAQTQSMVEKTAQEILNMKQQVLNMIEEIAKMEQEIAASQAGVTQSQERLTSDIALATEKTESETRLLDQKAITELGQTADVLPYGHPGMNVSPTIEGVIGKQKSLFGKQIDGFDRDAEQKLSKILVDTWSVRQTTDGEVASGAGLDNPEINRVLAKAKAGINY